MCWKKISPGCVSAKNIGGKIRGGTLEQCKTFCNQNENCTSIEYGVHHGGKRTNYKPGDCQLNSGSDSKGCDGFNNNLDLYVRIDCDGEFKSLGGMSV